MEKIKKIRLSKLRKYELPDLAERVINVIEEFEPESLKIKEAYDLLADQQPEIDILKWEYGPHEITPEVKTLRVKRAAYANVISTHARALNRAEVEGSDAGVKSVGMLSDLYLKNLRRHNEKTIHGKLSEFFRHIDEREDLELAFNSMGLTSHLNSLRNVHSALDELVERRDSSIAARPSVYLPPIAKSVRNALRNVFTHINLAQEKNTDLDYSLLISELNKRITHYTSFISNRMTISEKKKALEQEEAEAEAEKGANNGEQNTNDPDVVTEMTVPADKMIKLSVKEEKEEKENDDDITPLNEKKTAARSSKNEQLPSIDDEEIVS